MNLERGAAGTHNNWRAAARLLSIINVSSVRAGGQQKTKIMQPMPSSELLVYCKS